MALEFKDRVKDQTATTGTGTLTIDGIAPTGYRTITSAYTDGATIRFTVLSSDLTEWEVGMGVWTATGATLTRATVFANSLGDTSNVNFSAGDKIVFTGPMADDMSFDTTATAAPANGWYRYSTDLMRTPNRCWVDDTMLVGTSSASVQGLFTIDTYNVNGLCLLMTTSVTDSAAKAGMIGVRHYLSATEQPILLVRGQSTSGTNLVQVGGGSGSFNAATQIEFLTATDAITTTGTVQMRILYGAGGRTVDISGSATNPTIAASAGSLALASAVVAASSVKSTSATAGIGYDTGAGGAQTQGTSRVTGVTLNTVSGSITLFSEAGSATPQTFTVTNSAVAATDTIILSQKAGTTDLYHLLVTAVAAGSFNITVFTTEGTTTEAPVINFNVIKGVAA